MRRTRTFVSLLGLSACLLTGTGFAAAEPQKADVNKGITVDDIGRGLKSAAQNVEKEIPKIGSAIGETFKKLTGKDSDKQSAHSPTKDKK